MASKEVRSYNSARVLVIVAGKPISGLAEDTFVNFAPMADRVSAAVGADGEIARSTNPNRMHACTVTLQQTSADNDFFSGLAAMDDLTGGGSVFPIGVQDLSGRTLVEVSQAWIARTPDVSFGTTAGNREWTFHTAAPSFFTIGGNQ